MKLLYRVLPYPSLSLILWFAWMLLSGFTAGHAVLGAILAVLLPLGTRPFWPNVPRIRNLPKLLGFVVVVVYDIVVANVSVAIKVLGPLRIGRRLCHCSAGQHHFADSRNGIRGCESGQENIVGACAGCG